MTVRGQRPFRRALKAAGGVAVAATVLAACANHSGLRRLHPSDAPASAVALPSGLVGSGSAHTTPSRPASSPARSSTAGSSSGGAASSSASIGASHGVSRHSGSNGRRHHPEPSRSSSRPPSRPSSSVPPSPSVAVSPGRNLHDGQQVAVSGAYFPAGEQVSVQQCRADQSACLGLSARSVTVGRGGAFETPLVVNSTVWLQSCQTHGCVVQVRRSSGGVLVVPIAFG